MMCRRAKFSVIDSLTPISIFSNFRLALSYVTSSDSSAILVSARHAPERDPISITIFSISCSSSITLVSACHACNESSTKFRSCNRSSSAHEVPDGFRIISESSAESTLLTQAHVRKRCKKLTRLARPRNSGTVECMNIRILVDGAGALSMGAAAAGAVARTLRSTFSLVLANSFSETFATSSFRESLLESSIFLLLPQKFLGVEVPLNVPKPPPKIDVVYPTPRGDRGTMRTSVYSIPHAERITMPLHGQASTTAFEYGKGVEVCPHPRRKSLMCAEEYLSQGKTRRHQRGAHVSWTQPCATSNNPKHMSWSFNTQTLITS